MFRESTLGRDDFRLPAEPGGRKPAQTLAVCGFLLLAVWLVFGQTVRQEFVNLDDDTCVSENPRVTHGLSLQAVGWAFTHRLLGNWDPLTWISHMLDWRLYGPNAGGHHLTNVLLHAATAILLFLVLRQMTAGLWPSALAAALWAIHPLRVESVAWVTERKDVLSGLFFVLTLWAYASYARHRFSLVRYAGVIILFALGLLAKPTLATLPCVLLLLDYWPLGRIPRRVRACTHAEEPQLPARPCVRASTHPTALWQVLIEKLPLLALAVGCCAVTVWAQRVPDYPSRGAWWRIGNALISYVVYLRQSFCPTGLALLYPRRGPDLPVWQVVGAGLILLGITAAVVAWRRKCPYLLVGWLWYLAMLLPMVGLVSFGNEAPADRFTYLPQIGLCIAAAWGAADWRRLRPNRRRAAGAASALAVVALMGCAWQQTTYWRDSETLWTRTLACTTDNYWVHNLLGNALVKDGRIGDAELQFQAAIRIKPDYSQALYNLGVAAAGHGQIDQAMAYYRRATDADGGNALADNNLGYALLMRGEPYEALKHFKEALRVKPDFTEAHYNCGLALHALGHFRPAIAEYQEAIRTRPDYAEAHYNLGLALDASGRHEEARSHYQQAQKLAEARAGREKALGEQPK